jgi:hypothetical protein
VAKISIDPALYARAEKAAEAAGYSSTEEFVVHTLEKELEKRERTDEARSIADQLHGLGYVG